MITMHPEILSKDGKPQFAILSYEEFLQVEASLTRLSGGKLADPRYGEFYENLSAEELARRQGVKPIASVEELYVDCISAPSEWEGFDESLEQWRRESSTRD